MQNELTKTFDAQKNALRQFFSSRLSDTGIVDDLMQELYLKADGMGSKDIAYPKAYLFRMANNMIVDEHRRTAKLPQNSDIETDAIPTAISPERSLSAQEQLEVVTKALNELPEKTQMVFYRMNVNGMTKVEVAESLSISVNMVEKHLRRAIQYCRMKLEKSNE